MRVWTFLAMVLLTALTGVTALTPAVAADIPGVRTDRYGDPLPKGALLRLGTVRFSQPFPFGFVFSPDGKFLASGGSDHRIRLWDPDTGQELRILEGHKDSVYCLALSADGKWLASGGQDHAVRLWEVATGKVKQQFVGHDQPIVHVALSPNGKILASSCLGGLMRLWDTATGKEIRSLRVPGTGYWFRCMVFSPDSKNLAFSTRPEEGVQLMDVSNGKVIQTFKGHKDQVCSLTFLENGKRLLSASSDNTIRAWDMANGKELRRYGDNNQNITCLALAPNEKKMTYGTYPDGLVHILDVATNKELVAPWKAHRWGVVSIAYSPDSKKVALGRDMIAIHDTATGKRLNPTSESEVPVREVAYSGNGGTLAVWRHDKSLELWNTATWRKTATLQSKKGWFCSMAFSPRQQWLTTAEMDENQVGWLCHWDVQTGKRSKEFPLAAGDVEHLGYTADGEIIGGNHNNVFFRWDATTGKELGRIGSRPFDSIASNSLLSPDGKLMACGGTRHAVALWDTTTAKLVRGFGTFFQHGGAAVLIFSPSGKMLVTPGGKDVADVRVQIQPNIVLWETATGLERLQIPLKEGAITAVAFSPDGRLLASVSQTEAIYLWDAWTGKEIARFTGHRGSIRSLAFSPDGKTLASGGDDNSVLIWDVAEALPASRPEATKLGRDELAQCWDDLARMDAARAYRTLMTLSCHPEQAEALVKEKLNRKAGITREQLPRLIADLDSEDFATRENASKELANLGRLAEQTLRKTLEGKPSPEVRKRVQDLLGKLAETTITPEDLRWLRAIELLERLGTQGASQQLQKLARDSTYPAMAQDAEASLRRLLQRKTGRTNR